MVQERQKLMQELQKLELVEMQHQRDCWLVLLAVVEV